MSNNVTTLTLEISNEDTELIRNTICKGSTDVEFKLFLNQCRATGLNPLARQIFAVQRYDFMAKKSVMSIQVSIDGFRLIAERTGKYAGQVGPFWCGEDGIWKDVWLTDIPPVAARVGALRNDFKEPCWGVARFNAYAQRKKEGDLTRMWATMPDAMLCKCAEALALRKAFPQELSGVYSSDEMGQADNEQPKSAMAQWAKTPAPKPVMIEHATDKPLSERLAAFEEHLDKMRSTVSVTNLVAANNKLLFEANEHLPELYEKLGVKISQIQEAFLLADKDAAE